METTTISTLAAIAGLLVISAFFSGSETALTGASRARMHHLAKGGNASARLVVRLRENQERTIGAILLGNNLVNILASALATTLFIDVMGEGAVIYATAAMTLLVVVFGEVMPKTYAVWHADRAALMVAPFFRYVVIVLAPITLTLVVVVSRMLRLLGVRPTTDRAHIAPEELRGVIDLHRGHDPEVRHERVMLRSILDLADVEVGMIMQHRKGLASIDADLPTSEIVDKVLESPFTRLPLWRGTPDNIIGVLHAKALLREVNAHPGRVDEIDITTVSSKPWFIPDTTTLLEQLQEFRRRREHFALVVDEYGSLQGVVTLEDIIEEIVGDILDEHDVVMIGVRAQADGTYVVAGNVTVRDLNRRFEWHLPDEKAATIAGLIIHEARLLPQTGQIFTFYGFRFEILRRQRNQITLVRVTPPGVGIPGRAGS